MYDDTNKISKELEKNRPSQKINKINKEEALIKIKSIALPSRYTQRHSRRKYIKINPTGNKKKSSPFIGYHFTLSLNFPALFFPLKIFIINNLFFISNKSEEHFLPKKKNYFSAN